ncbi:MAG TPA: hypothetical protein VK812_16585 [Candidatus Binatus sp.]|jgi:hypothetical protein|nr:hypothetical protein [Candidatus Binatus sp.]
MKITFGDLWRSNGTIGRGAYALVGVLGFAIKHNLDRLVASYGFHRPWGLFNYWVPVRDVARITELRGNEAVFLGTMVALSLPFIWVGVVLTMKRLRSAGLPTHLVALFFLPFLNLLFFLILCFLPERSLLWASPKADSRQGSSLARIFPESALGSAAISLLITVPVGLGVALLGAQVLTNYGWGLFVALPFTMGFAAALVYGTRQPRTMSGCVGVACLAVTLLGGALLALAFEGMVCLIMATPIAVPLAAFGGVCAYRVQRRKWFQTDAPVLLSALLVFVPGIEWMEHVAATPSATFVARTAIDVQAPPERVWREVVAFSEIPAPTEWMFRAGIAYPIRAEMLGSGAGAERHCVFSTGAFVEPIEVWDEPRLLKFSVTSNPPPMEEWTPYSRIEPPHLHGFLVSEGGQFLLTPLANGGTRLEGTTWYRHGLWPAAYWQLWSDAIIHRIHLRVLRHIRDEAEQKTRCSDTSVACD